MSFEYNRFLGRVATLVIVCSIVTIPMVSILTSLLRISYANLFSAILFTIVSYVGHVLFLIAMNRIANYYQTRAIFRNALYAFIATVIGSLIFIILTYGTFSSLTNFLETMQRTPRSLPPASVFVALFSFLVIIWLGSFLLAIVQGIFYRRAFYVLAEKSGEQNFRKAGYLMFVGGILTIIVVGALLFFVGWIFVILGFFNMKPQVSSASLSLGKVQYFQSL